MRPRLAEDVEKRLEPIEERSAACYADAEEIAQRIRRVATDLDALEAIPTPWDDEDDSLVHHIEELRAKTQKETP